ncbi:MAG: TVP38/TMEM64 family protein [Erysipelotrichia bacterium]|nr:TVP38/TMEM64 family protein [Erysipelotrichia bacterium]
MDKKKKVVIGFSLIALAVGFTVLIILYIGIPMVKMAQEPAQFKAYIAGLGPYGWLIFMGMIILQVIVAVIPGGPFQIASGYVYGAIWGTVLCDIATTLGSLFVFLLVRKFGLSFIELFFAKEKIESVKILKSTEKQNFLIFLLFLIPGTPKDLLSYLVGLTDMKISTWLLITSAGRLPAILLSTLSGSALSSKRYEIFAIVMAVILVFSIAGMVFYSGHNKDDSRGNA